MSASSSYEATLSPELPEFPAQASKRQSRACDQCRRTKGRCRKNAETDRPCLNCAISGLACTFQSPTYKRGPPKGYISAIEQRLHQVEAVLGAIISSGDERSREIVYALKTDEIASEIIDRVEHGPYGPPARTNGGSLGPADFSATIRQLNSTRDNPSMRSSREDRESLSSSSREIPIPSLEWLERIDGILGRLDQNDSAFAASSGRSNLSESATADNERSEGEAVEKIEDEKAIGKLSINENDEIRYHSETSGMHLLYKIVDNTFDRNYESIWRLPRARVWPYAPMHFGDIGIENDSITLQWPSIENETILIELYFTYAHPELPVLHKPTFMALYQTYRSYTSENTPNQPSNKMTIKLVQLLLLSIFAVASRFYDKEAPIPKAGCMWEAGCMYLASAKRILTIVLPTAALNTCQALVILAYREFGLGSLEQSSSFIALAVRMAQDLGLHRSADRWQRQGADVFSPDQKQERKHIWWSCALAETTISCSLGKPLIVREDEYDVEFPDGSRTVPLNQVNEDFELWQSHFVVLVSPSQEPVLCRISSTFKASAALSIIIGRIIEKVYPVRQEPRSRMQELLSEFDKALGDWVLGLPAHIQYDIMNKHPVPPQTLLLHIQHLSAVILLHRRFMPHVSNLRNAESAYGIDSEREFSLCRVAAERICELTLVLRDIFTLKAVSAYLPSYLMSAGIINLAALAMNRGDTERSISVFRNILACLKEMEYVWPSAMRNHELLGNAYRRFEPNIQTIVVRPERDLTHHSHFSRFTTLSEGAEVMAEVAEVDVTQRIALTPQLLEQSPPGPSNPAANLVSWLRPSDIYDYESISSGSQNNLSPSSAMTFQEDSYY